MKLALVCEAQRIRTGEALVEVEALVFCNGAELYGQHVANGRSREGARGPRRRTDHNQRAAVLSHILLDLLHLFRVEVVSPDIAEDEAIEVLRHRLKRQGRQVLFVTSSALEVAAPNEHLRLCTAVAIDQPLEVSVLPAGILNHEEDADGVVDHANLLGFLVVLQEVLVRLPRRRDAEREVPGRLGTDHEVLFEDPVPAFDIAAADSLVAEKQVHTDAVSRDGGALKGHLDCEFFVLEDQLGDIGVDDLDVDSLLRPDPDWEHADPSRSELLRDDLGALAFVAAAVAEHDDTGKRLSAEVLSDLADGRSKLRDLACHLRHDRCAVFFVDAVRYDLLVEGVQLHRVVVLQLRKQVASAIVQDRLRDGDPVQLASLGRIQIGRLRHQRGIRCWCPLFHDPHAFRTIHEDGDIAPRFDQPVHLQDGLHEDQQQHRIGQKAQYTQQAAHRRIEVGPFTLVDLMAVESDQSQYKDSDPGGQPHLQNAIEIEDFNSAFGAQQPIEELRHPCLLAMRCARRFSLIQKRTARSRHKLDSPEPAPMLAKATERSDEPSTTTPMGP